MDPCFILIYFIYLFPLLLPGPSYNPLITPFFLCIEIECESNITENNRATPTLDSVLSPHLVLCAWVVLGVLLLMVCVFCVLCVCVWVCVLQKRKSNSGTHQECKSLTRVKLLLR
jgi:hypothetical protein